MDAAERLAQRFEAERPYLHTVARRMLGSTADADDAVQETWLRLSRSDVTDVENLRGWLTTVTTRICLDALRTRRSRREEPMEIHLPTLAGSTDGHGAEDEAVLGETVNLALYLVLDQLRPAERVAFVLHDLFGVPFDAIATMLGRSAAATKQLGSRARARVRLGETTPSPATVDHAVVEAFFTAARAGDFEALLGHLDAQVELQVDTATAVQLVRGADAVAARALMFARPDATLTPLVANGRPAVLVTVDGKPVSLMVFTVEGDRVVGIRSWVDPQALAELLPSWLVF